MLCRFTSHPCAGERGRCKSNGEAACVCPQALGDMLSPSRSGQTSGLQAESSEQYNSPDVYSKSAAVSRRGSAAMPSVTLKAPAASRRGSIAAAVPMDSEYTDEVKTKLGVEKLNTNYTLFVQTSTWCRCSRYEYGLLLL